MRSTLIGGEKFFLDSIYEHNVSIPDCFVMRSNKLGGGNGEAKLYLGTKDEMRSFFGNEAAFVARCFLLKSDLLTYLNAIEKEYKSPTQNYKSKEEFPKLWDERYQKVSQCDEFIYFDVSDQDQIQGPRGYVNTSKNEFGYQLIRELSLPSVSFISIMHLVDKYGDNLFYWKLFVDYDALKERTPLVFTYGKGKNGSHPHNKTCTVEKKSTQARVGQGKYRDALFNELPVCPITRVADDALLFASHIKPWAVSTPKEQVDPKNGFLLSPLYDKLFDCGYITFSDDKKLIASKWFREKDIKALGVTPNKRYPLLPIDQDRIKYLEYHRKFVFKG